MNMILVIFTTILGGFVGGFVVWLFLWKTTLQDLFEPDYKRNTVHPRRRF